MSTTYTLIVTFSVKPDSGDGIPDGYVETEVLSAQVDGEDVTRATNDKLESFIHRMVTETEHTK